MPTSVATLIDRKAETAVWRMTISGFCAILIGLGLSRFAYSPLLPELIVAHWFTPSQTAYLGAANLAGYLCGALLARFIAAHIATAPLLRSAMIVAGTAFFACSSPISFLWFFAWRFLSGVSGGILMVSVAPAILPHVPPRRRGFISGIIFVAAGCGIIASGVLVPLFLRGGLSLTWRALGGICLLLTAIAWNGWPETRPVPPGSRSILRPSQNGALKALYLAYGVSAIGQVPHMIFLVDFIVRGLGYGIAAGSHYWMLFGLGALAGPIVAGHLGDRIGFGPALRIGFLLQCAAVATLAMRSTATFLAVSSLVAGIAGFGVVNLALGRTHELTGGVEHLQRAAWSLCTTAFAIGQAAGAYGLSYIFARTAGSYVRIFALGAMALALSIAIETGVTFLAQRRPIGGHGGHSL